MRASGSTARKVHSSSKSFARVQFDFASASSAETREAKLATAAMHTSKITVRQYRLNDKVGCSADIRLLPAIERARWHLRCQHVHAHRSHKWTHRRAKPRTTPALGRGH